ncbi:MAG: Gfo/Idh/MocA family oxidoreductase [Candidatus Heimdallarchaeota archaeon]
MKLGIIGLGNWGRRVAEEANILLNEGVIDDLYLCDIDDSLLKKFKDNKTTKKTSDLLTKVDAVHICSPNKFHFQNGKEALDNNLHTLIEKPMTINQYDAFELLELALEKGLVLQVGHIFRFANVVKKLREYYQNNEFGKVNYLNLEWTHYMEPMTNTNVVWDLAPHPIDILNFITSDWPVKIFGIAKCLRQNDFFEMAILQTTYKSDLNASIHISWANPIKRRRIELVGSKASAIVESVKQSFTLYRNDGSKEEIPVEKNNTIRDELVNFVDSIKTRKNANNSGVIGLRTVELIERAIMNLMVVQ